MKDIKKALILISPIFVGLGALFFGAYSIDPHLVGKILINEIIHLSDLKDTPEKAIVLDIRLPRVLLSATVGAYLSGSGVVLQAVFRNPLVDPFILGISAGAAFGCSITIGFLSFFPIQIMAFLFSLVAVFSAYIIAKTGGDVSRLSLVLSGVVVSAFFTALVSIVKFLVDPHKLQSIVYWLMGSFSLSNWRYFKISLLGLPAIFPLFLMRWRLNIISMGDEEAKALGIDVKKERIIFILLSSFLAAIATSICGIIGWIGLMVPHLVRMIVGPDHRDLFPLSLTFGASFMIAADTFSRTITRFDIPVGIITALSGAPFFVYLMRKTKREVWSA